MARGCARASDDWRGEIGLGVPIADRARTRGERFASAGTAEARSTRTLILISLVVIIWRLMPASASASNMAVATPVCVRMPRPTTEILATSASWVISVAPISRGGGLGGAQGLGQVALGDREADLGRPAGRHVLDDHVDDDVGGGDRAKDRVDHAGPVRHARGS